MTTVANRFAVFLRTVMLAAMALACLTAGAFASDPPVATDGRVVGDESRTRFVLDLSGEVDLSAFTLDEPYRVVIDLPEIDFRLPSGTGSTGRGLVSDWRYGQFAAGRSRIVLDVTGPVKIDKAFVLPAVENQPARMVLDLLKTTSAAFEEEQRKSQLARDEANQPVQKADQLPPPDRSKREKPLIVIDAGHGGVDAGTVSASGVLEKDIVLAFAKKLQERLEQTGKVAVLLSRTDDTFLPLGSRVQFARDHAADLFLSIHADSEHEGSVRGATVYTLSDKASDREAAALAAKENASDLIAGLDLQQEADDVTDILVDLTRRETRNFSAAFANGLIGDLASATRMIKNPRRSAGFQVLKAHDVPSVLVEIGYLSNDQDEKLLTSDEWRSRVADAVTQAVLRFFGQKYAYLGK
ncbi:N-acetylmuramoyl-L-alanine amidase AmiC [Pleomorphomonas sp. T1.2MG-36]|uniref:N-acetylmuramoyl-L-alanine amidase n=1 Tax=Pleomorphomonas sp. T1.2MG-36 TaxID=3041167 RepID=UPI0024774AE1|nr:N-acetylmuramoyl-L-alanine amidase [Pleomorphomonas sp. T1.2MG-36]CAI9405105.1 N-acetylmuramoyl-L-alanine amidase AmiC [Pleomorphomonas sp. T1.2MG-36]